MKHHPCYQITCVSNTYLSNEQVEHIAEVIEASTSGVVVVSIVPTHILTKSHVLVSS